jgi:predicted nucleic acid-binding protein
MHANYFNKLIISDTSCLIALTNIGRLDLLRDLCKTVYVTPEVSEEYGVPLPDWIQIMAVKDAKKIQTIETFLDLGESSAIALALETENSLLILDDGKARRYAKHIGLPLTGTLGLLLVAQEVGILEDFDTIISKLKENNFRIPSSIEKIYKKG